MVRELKIRRARKPHQCTEGSWHTIQPGDLYLFCDNPPWGEQNRTGERWEYIRACLRCAKKYGMLTSEQKKAMGIEA